MESEFGSDPKTMVLKGARLCDETSIRFVSEELTAAKHTKFLDDEIGSPSEIDEDILQYVMMQLTIRETVSPYEDCTKRDVLARIRKALAGFDPEYAASARNADIRMFGYTPTVTKKYFPFAESGLRGT